MCAFTDSLTTTEKLLAFRNIAKWMISTANKNGTRFGLDGVNPGWGEMPDGTEGTITVYPTDTVEHVILDLICE